MRQWWKEHGRKWAFRLCGLALAAAVAVSLLPETVVVPASAVTQAEIDAMREEANDLKSQQKEIQDQAGRPGGGSRATPWSARPCWSSRSTPPRRRSIPLPPRSPNTMSSSPRSRRSSAQAEAEEQAQYELFCERVRYMEEQGEVSYWSILFSSNDFADLLDNAMMVEEIMDYDNQVMDQLIALREQIEEDKAELETARQEQQAAKEEQEAAQANLQSQEAEVDRPASTRSAARRTNWRPEEAQLQAAANAADAEIAAAERELAAQITNVVSESGFMWPLPGYYNLSSSVWRPHPPHHRKGPTTTRASTSRPPAAPVFWPPRAAW